MSYRPGQRVRIDAREHEGHHRTPAYVKGKTGTVERVYPAFRNPETRTLVQVKSEDLVEADRIFTILMGEQVEPRRQFIEENALTVKNLDI